MEYNSKLSLLETEIAIKEVKDYFERNLAKKMNLIRVSAPLFVKPETGLNDNLNGHEEAVGFTIKNINAKVEIVQSLAKWKRYALNKYQIPLHQGIYTDMNAIRKDEEIDYLHSAYVDQWDWEKIIIKEDRTKDYLFKTVQIIYESIKETEVMINEKYPCFKKKLPEDIYFISTKELDARYPNITPKEREYIITKEKRAVFIFQIGWPLLNGKPHDGRAADYDDWHLNGDILVYDEVIDTALELSSMGIRVNQDSIIKQLNHKGEQAKLTNPYVKSIIDGTLPQTIGGGIGQSRLCLFLLEKMHIGEVQSSIWSDEEKLENLNIL